MPRLVRRKPLSERIMAALNPMDFLLWLSEEIETSDWDSKVVGTQLGLAMNFIFLLARSNSGRSERADDVFDDSRSSGWLIFFANFSVWALVIASASNAFYTLTRSRHYRLFEADVEKRPETPSAHRVRVQSSPVSSSPLRFLANVMNSESAESRAHPDRTRDVWELSVWDPSPISLRIFCLFSPGHVLVYMLFLPLVPLDPHPSVTIFKCVILQGLLSGQMILLQSRFTQQAKDTAIIQREVMHEYDTKFVHPRLYPTVRDAATQLSLDDPGHEYEFVEVGKPTTVLRRGFQTHANPNYAKHIDPDTTVASRPSNVMNPGLFTPPVTSRSADAFSSAVSMRPSGLRRSTPAMQSSSTQSASENAATHQGYLGAFAHPSSPLKKTPSLGDLQYRSPRNNAEMAKLEQYQQQPRDRSSSPMKSSRKSTGTLPSAGGSFYSRQNPSYERYPSMWSR